jgi:proteasome inhibitor subunit 1 (PI31)
MAAPAAASDDAAAQIVRKLARRRPQVRDAHDVVALALHLHVLQRGWTCIGLREEDEKDAIDFGPCPDGWNANADGYSFLYRLPAGGGVVLARMVRIDDSLMLHALRKGSEVVQTLEVQLASVVDAAALAEQLRLKQANAAHAVAFSRVLHSGGLAAQLALLDKQVVQALAPAPAAGRRGGAAGPRQGQPLQPALPNPLIDPRFGGPRFPGPAPAGGDFDPDVFPLPGGVGADPFGGPLPARPGGNLVGPDSDLFDPRRGPTRGRGRGRGPRFDPYGPLPRSSGE